MITRYHVRGWLDRPYTIPRSVPAGLVLILIPAPWFWLDMVVWAAGFYLIMRTPSWQTRASLRRQPRRVKLILLNGVLTGALAAYVTFNLMT